MERIDREMFPEVDLEVNLRKVTKPAVTSFDDKKNYIQERIIFVGRTIDEFVIEQILSTYIKKPTSIKMN